MFLASGFLKTFESAISFINNNYLLLNVLTTALFIVLFVITILVKKRIDSIGLLIFVLSFALLFVFYLSDSAGYRVYWKNRPELSLAFFSSTIYGLALICDIFVAIFARKKEKAVEEKVEETNVTNEVEIDPYLETIDEAIGFFDDRIKGYHLTKKMREALCVNKNTLTVEELKHFIADDDQMKYDSIVKQTSGSMKYRYRLKTNQGVEWFEESRTVKKDEIIGSFHKVLMSKENTIIYDRRDLEIDISKLISTSDDFGLTFISISNNQSIIKRLGKETASIIVENYLKMIKNDLFKSDDEAYKISNNEYCILTTDMDLYFDNIHNVKNRNSELLEANINYEGNKYFVTNVLGFVNSSDVLEKNPLECVEAGRLAIYLATTKESHYMEYKVEELKDNNEEFEKYKVDISNDFLKKL